MKGPGFRNKVEVRRRWKCPECGKEVLVPGEQTAVWCNCQKQEKSMTLVEEYVPHIAQRFVYVPPKPEESEPENSPAQEPASDK